VNRELLPRAALPNRSQMLLGNAEDDKDRSHLIDDDEWDVVRLHQIAGMDEEVAGTSGDRGMDLRIA
jgi:hypothetical protein